MSSFILRNLDPEFWRRVQAKADAEGVKIYDLIVRLLTQWLAAAILVGLVSGCGYKLPTEPTAVVVVPSSAPASIRLGVSSMTASTYGITATVLTHDGHFVAGVLVTFAMDAGSVTPAEATTNANGVAQAVATASTAAAILTVSGGSLTTTTSIAGAPAIAQPGPNPIPTPPAPVGALSVTISAADVHVGTQTIFTANVQGGPAMAFSWTFGDGTGFSGSSASTAHTYGAVGNYVADVTITDGLGRRANASTTATVNAIPPPPPPPPPPVAMLLASLTCTVATHGSPTSCNVTTIYGGSPIPSTDIRRIEWDMGNGQGEVTTGPVIGYTYPLAGTYLVVAGIHADVTIDGAFVPKTTFTSKTVVIP